MSTSPQPLPNNLPMPAVGLMVGSGTSTGTSVGSGVTTTQPGATGSADSAEASVVYLLNAKCSSCHNTSSPYAFKGNIATFVSDKANVIQ